jgi:hypothetical protein
MALLQSRCNIFPVEGAAMMVDGITRWYISVGRLPTAAFHRPRAEAFRGIML